MFLSSPFGKDFHFGPYGQLICGNVMSRVSCLLPFQVLWMMHAKIRCVVFGVFFVRDSRILSTIFNQLLTGPRERPRGAGGTGGTGDTHLGSRGAVCPRKCLHKARHGAINMGKTHGGKDTRGVEKAAGIGES